jgi:hypothetical protein
MDAAKISQIILEDRRQWQLLIAVLDAHSDKPLHGTPANPWKSQDVYAHLARWLERSNGHMTAYIHGHNLSTTINNPEELNSLWKMEDSHMSLAEARAKANQAFEERIRILRSIPPEKWDFKLEKIAAYDGAEHYKAHRNYIKLD